MRWMVEIGGRRAVLAGVLTAFLSHGVAADLVGHTQTRTAVAGKSDEALIEANPVLERLGWEHPEALREALDRLRTPAGPEPPRRRTLARTAREPETGTESALLAENPDLAELYRESPEAALDLLRLIREAAKKK